MKVVYTDLIKFFANNPSISDISTKLFQLGHEHEEQDGIFDIEFTPNRGDCLSLRGLARDLNVFYETNLNLPYYEDEIDVLDFKFKNLAIDDCPKISFLEIEVESLPLEYDDYLEDYFQNLNISKNNFFTDISNYLAYELGQPTHCFDSQKLNGELTFETKECDDIFITLHNEEVHLQGKNCVFLNNNKIISLAGIMGGKSSACSEETKKVLIECAFFKPESIIGRSTKYNINSDAAYKFERGVDIDFQELTLRRFIKIIEDHSKIKSLKTISFISKSKKDEELPINIGKINSILGLNISSDKYKEILLKLGFDIDSKIKIPSHRLDIKTQNDLAEEVARVIGYDNIETKPFDISFKKTHKHILNLDAVKQFLITNGFSEVINFPFASLSNKKSISIDNPLDSNKKNLRINLKDSLVENLLYNERRQNDSIKLFEVSNIYTQSSRIEQDIKIGLIVSGRKGHNYDDFSIKLDEEYLKIILKQLFQENEINIEYISRENLDSKIKNSIFYAELKINKINQNLNYEIANSFDNNFITYTPVSEFPLSNRDFSFLISDHHHYDEFISKVYQIQDPYIKKFYIFDFYKNHKMQQIKVGVRLVFQAKDKTLSDVEIKNSISKVLKPIISIKGVSVPGLNL